KLKKAIDIPIHMQCHATTGMSTATYIKAIEAGVENVDTSISSMSMTYGHSATEALVAIMNDTDTPTGLDMVLLQEIADYFTIVRKKYAKFEGSLKGIDARIIIAQVPGGMLTNMESQLKEQNAGHKMDLVLAEIPRVRKDLGMIPLVTPTSQIVGSQAVINILTGERYKSMTKETAAVLKGEYGATSAPVNRELQLKVLAGAEAITCRPADLIDAEMDKLTAELRGLVAEKGLKMGDHEVEDVLTYALFQQVGLKFLEHRDNPAMFEPVPTGEETAAPAKAAPAAPAVSGGELFTVTGGGQTFVVQVAKASGAAAAAAAAASAATGAGTPAAASASGTATAGHSDIVSPLAGNVWKIEVDPGQQVQEGDLLLILEAMKMENEIFADRDGIVGTIHIEEGNAVTIGQPLVTLIGAGGAAQETKAPAQSAATAKVKGGVTAPLAGNVWKIEVAEGQKVQEGDLLLILEAMKMENEIFADRDGTIGQILIQEGTAVTIGDTLLTID
ncbi:MAG TPA: biotin/lipoyl-binding protein, partial [Desulfuromonadales bacterium]|nr:biotin/lipoyl-binding protein [Desulfuromonadales bacterium]